MRQFKKIVYLAKSVIIYYLTNIQTSFIMPTPFFTFSFIFLSLNGRDTQSFCVIAEKLIRSLPKKLGIEPIENFKQICGSHLNNAFFIKQKYSRGSRHTILHKVGSLESLTIKIFVCPRMLTC